MLVGDGTLEYAVGFLEYVEDSSSSSVAELVAILLGSLLGLIVLLIICIVSLCCFFVWKRHLQRWFEMATWLLKMCRLRIYFVDTGLVIMMVVFVGSMLARKMFMKMSVTLCMIVPTKNGYARNFAFFLID